MENMESELELATRFDQERSRLLGIAQRILGPSGPLGAEDAVQEAWFRLARLDDDVDNLPAWLTTVVSRICLDALRSHARHEALAETLAGQLDEVAPGPEEQAQLDDSLSVALLVVLDTLSPAERVAFVLHDLFGAPFEEVAAATGRSAAAARQLASRARRRVRGQAGLEPSASSDDVPESPTADVTDGARAPRAVVEAFLTAAKGGDLAALVRLLDPDVVMTSDATAAAMGSPALKLGRDEVSGFFNGKAKAARFAMLGGEPGLVWQYRGVVQVAFTFQLRDGVIHAVRLIGDRAELDRLTA
ncbi:sigma-70 family RNA polymerase sigma factor [Arthrobacter sp. Y-9]|uniref:sigma-70 family RNA polymerase sigma factor n=1 Tax=Arthrobacter sp. Y-9 TaxID=3039385 RepID=UPI00241F2CC4|nr:sigma-70 family RNA polymerase sigma factor [Arthrobacter sp. Y-9]WFR83947.1 sigma-70 family RNA polymerase sigma factor [Arthrobacter sp. Y-9]